MQFCRAGARSITRIARDLDLSETALGSWVMRAQEDRQEESAGGALTSSGREEFHELRRVKIGLRRRRDILRNAAAFLAREPT